MRFLLDSLKRHKQRLRLEELIIIALRVLACLLLGFMLSNIRMGGEWPGTRTASGHVFVLDDSLSMGQKVGEAFTIHQKAVTGLARQIGELKDNDMVAVVSACRPENSPLGVLTLARELKRDDFTRRLTSLRPTDLRARFPEAIEEARKLLHAQKGLAGHVYVISDFRTGDWTQAGAARPAREALRKACAALAEAKTELILLDYGLECRGNLTLEKLELTDKLAVAGVGSGFEVTVRNTGTGPVEGASLTPSAGAVTLPAIPFPTIPPGQSLKRNFRYVFPSAGWSAVKVTLTADSLPADNQAALAVPVREAVRVLVVDDSTAGAASAAAPGPAAASFCLCFALDPSGKGEFGQKVDVVSPRNTTESELEGYDAVFLVNVRELPEAKDEGGKRVYPQLAALERYVRGGGGLGIFLGDRVNPDFYSGPLYGDGAGLAPLPLAPAALPQVDETKYVRLRPDTIAAEPMLRIFTGRSEAFSRLVRFYGFVAAGEGSGFRVQGSGVGTHPSPLTPDSSARTPTEILARFDDARSSPAVARRAFGRGTVIMWFTAADTKWTDWPKGLCFVPVVNDMLWTLLRSTGESLHGQVGQAIAFNLPPSMTNATGIWLKTPAYPDEDVQLLPPRGQGSARSVAYANPRWAGIYEMEVALPDRTRQTVLFSRQFDPAEGDLAKARREEILAAIDQPDAPYQGNLSLQPQLAQSVQERKAWWLGMLMALLGVLVLESFLAQRFGHHVESGQ